MSERKFITTSSLLKSRQKNRLKSCLDIRTTISAFFLLVILNISHGQKIDSLKSILVGETGSDRCDLLYQLAFEYIDLDNQLGLKYAREAFTSAKEIGDSLRIVKSGRIKSLAFRRLGELDSSMALSIEMLAIAKRHHFADEIKSHLNALALMYTHKAHYDKALKYYFLSLEMSEKDRNKYLVWVTLNNIGLVYYKLEDYDKALTYFEQSLTRKSSRSIDDAIALINISLCYAYKSNFLRAQDFVRQAQALCRNDCPKNLQMYASFSSGFISFGLKKLDFAEIDFKKSYQLSLELDDERYQLDNIVYLSKVYLKAGKIEKAGSFLREAERLIAAGASYNLGLIQIYSELGDLHKKKDDFERVAVYREKYIQLKDSIYSEELTRNLMRVESEYLERENKALIVSQAKILSLNDEVILRQRFINAFVGITALLLIVLSYVLIRSNRRERATNLFLEQKVRERTVELEQSNDALVRSLDEHTIVFQKLSSEMKSFIATIKGLCSLSLTDSETTDGGQYIRKIEATSDQLLGIVNRTLSSKTTK